MVYTIIVSKDGQNLATFPNKKAFWNDLSTGDCELSLSTFSSGIKPQDFSKLNNLTYILNFNTTARRLDLTFAFTDGSA